MNIWHVDRYLSPDKALLSGGHGAGLPYGASDAQAKNHGRLRYRHLAPLILIGVLGAACQLPAEPDVSPGPEAPAGPEVPGPEVPLGPAPERMPNPGLLVIERASYDFGQIHVSAKSPETSLTVRNGGPEAIGGLTVHLEQDVGFSIAATTCAGWLEPSATCFIAVRFEPGHAGTVQTDLVAKAGDLLARTTLTGTGAATLRVINRVPDIQALSEPAGIDCGFGSATCEVTFTTREVTLSASYWGSARYIFWNGPCEPNDGGPCRVSLEADATIELRHSEVGLLWYEDGYMPGTLAVDSGNNLIVASASDQRLFKYSPAGELLWQRDDLGWSYDIATDSLGNIGTVDFSTLRKLDGAGNLQWSIDLAAGAFWGQVVEFDADGNLYVAGTASITEEEIIARVQKYSAGGALLWTRDHGPRPRSVAVGLAVDRDGNVIVAGQGQYYFDDDSNFIPEMRFLNKYDRNGDVLWVDEDVPVGDWAGVDAAGNIFVAGTDWWVSPGLYVIQKRSPDGALLWQAQEDSYEGTELAMSAAGDVFFMTLQPDWDGYLDTSRVSKLSGSTGEWQGSLWIQPDGDSMYTHDLAVDASGNVVVSGVVGFSSAGWLRKYDSAMFGLMDE